MKVCILLDDQTLRRWQADAITHLLEHGDVEVTTILYDEYDRSKSTFERVKRAIELREWTVVAMLNAAFQDPDPRLDRVHIDSVVDRDGIYERSVDPEIVDGWKERIPKTVVDDVSDDVDVAIRFGFGFLVGPLLTDIEHGVLSFHHGDIQEYRGQPFGFWEFVHDQPTAGITLQQLTEELDAGRIAALKTVDITDLHTWEAIRRRLLDESEDMLTTGIESLRTGDVHEPASLGELYTIPRGLPVFRFALKNTKGRILEAIQRSRQ